MLPQACRETNIQTTVLTTGNAATASEMGSPEHTHRTIHRGRHHSRREQPLENRGPVFWSSRWCESLTSLSPAEHYKIFTLDGTGYRTAHEAPPVKKFSTLAALLSYK